MARQNKPNAAGGAVQPTPTPANPLSPPPPPAALPPSPPPPPAAAPPPTGPLGTPYTPTGGAAPLAPAASAPSQGIGGGKNGPGGGATPSSTTPDTTAGYGGTKRNPTQSVWSGTQLTSQQQQLIDMAMPMIQGFEGPEFRSDSVVGFNPTQLAAQDAALGAAPRQDKIAQLGASTSGYLLDPANLTPNNNPALRATMDAANRPLIDTYLESILPSTRGEALVTGNFGSSRHGIAEGIAARGVTNAVADNNARIATDGYGRQLDAMTSALGYLPATTNNLTAPAATIAAVGDTQQQQSQAVRDAEISSQWNESMFPWLVAQDLISLAGGTPGGATSTVGPAPKQNILGQIMGGLGTFASMFSPFS